MITMHHLMVSFTVPTYFSKYMYLVGFEQISGKEWGEMFYYLDCLGGPLITSHQLYSYVGVHLVHTGFRNYRLRKGCSIVQRSMGFPQTLNGHGWSSNGTPSEIQSIVHFHISELSMWKYWFATSHSLCTAWNIWAIMTHHNSQTVCYFLSWASW